MTVIEIPDDQAAKLKAKAAAQGLGLKAWLGKLAEEEERAEPRPKKSATVSWPNTGPALPPRRLMRTAARCFAASAKTSDDRRRRRYAYGPLVSAKKSVALRQGAAVHG